MTSTDLIPTALLARKAVVYVRQSTQSQVITNLESQRRQYDLVDVARQRGFSDVEVIDDDLGRSASGTVARPGFDRLVALLCAGKVGAVFCFDASRLARNGRDWHHLLELCGLVEARVIDHDGVYNPCRPNDRLLLGMKGSISEFELGVRMDASPLSQCDRHPQKPLLRGRLRLWEEREADCHRRWTGSAQLRARQARRYLGGDDPGPSRRLHQLGRIRA